MLLMSAPFADPPAVPFNTADSPQANEAKSGRSIHDDLAAPHLGPVRSRGRGVLRSPNDAPSTFISGKSDWGVYEAPGALKAMRTRARTRMLVCHLVEGAGHSVQQEHPEAVSRLLLEFLEGARS